MAHDLFQEKSALLWELEELEGTAEDEKGVSPPPPMLTSLRSITGHGPL